MSELSDIAEITRLRRMKRKVAETRQKRRRHPHCGGTLREFMERDGKRWPKHFEPFAEHASRIPDERSELCLSGPPRHGKTTLLHYLVAWLLICFPHWRIAWVSYGAKFSEENIAAIKAIYVRAGGVLGEKQTEAVWTTGAGGLLRGTGLDGPLTGRGFNLVVCDDAHQNLQSALSRTISSKVIAGYRANVWSRKVPRIGFPVGTSFIVSHTRWTDADLISDLVTAAESSWTYYNFPALTPEGEALAPDFFTTEDIERERKGVGEHAFAALYLGNPRPVGGILFGNVVTVDKLESGGSWRYALGVDIAFSARTRADYNVACVMRRHVTTGVVQVIEVLRQQGTLADRVTGRGDEPEWSEGFLRSLHGLSQRYPGAPIHMYVAKNETLVIGLAARHDKYPVRIKATLADTNKWLRATRYAEAWSSVEGRVEVLRTAPWSAEFMREHMNFTGDPNSGHDDQVDAAVAAFDALVPMVRSGGRASGTGEGSRARDLGNAIAV